MDREGTGFEGILVGSQEGPEQSLLWSPIWSPGWYAVAKTSKMRPQMLRIVASWTWHHPVDQQKLASATIWKARISFHGNHTLQAHPHLDATVLVF